MQQKINCEIRLVWKYLASVPMQLRHLFILPDEYFYTKFSLDFFSETRPANISRSNFFPAFCSLHLFSRIFILFTVKIPSLALRYPYIHLDLRIPFLAYFDQKRIPSVKPKLKIFSLLTFMLNIQLFSADTTILLIFHMFCPWKHEKLPSKVA